MIALFSRSAALAALVVMSTACSINVGPDGDWDDDDHHEDGKHSAVNKSFTIGSDDKSGNNYETVNGEISIASAAEAGELETVNGGITVGEGAKIRDTETVNGSIILGSGVKVEGDVETVNGSVTAGNGTSISQDVETVNGSITLSKTTVGGDVESVSGPIILQNGTVVSGDIVVPNQHSWGKNKPAKVVIGRDCVVKGEIDVREGTLVYVHETAKIWTVEGAEAVKFSGENPPE